MRDSPLSAVRGTAREESEPLPRRAGTRVPSRKDLFALWRGQEKEKEEGAEV